MAEGIVVRLATPAGRPGEVVGGAGIQIREMIPHNVVLHASAEGRALYERLGFRQTNEMRYEGL